MFVQLTNYEYLYIKICCLLQIAVTPIAVINTIFIKRKWKLNTIYRLETNVYFPTNKKQCLAKNCWHRMFFFETWQEWSVGLKTVRQHLWPQGWFAALNPQLFHLRRSPATVTASEPDTPSPWMPALSFAAAADPRRDRRKSTKHLDQYI